MSNYKVTSSEQMYRLRLFLNTRTPMDDDNIRKRTETRDFKLLKIRECGGMHCKSSQKKHKEGKKSIEKKSTRWDSQRIQRLAHTKKEKGNI